MRWKRPCREPLNERPAAPSAPMRNRCLLRASGSVASVDLPIGPNQSADVDCQMPVQRGAQRRARSNYRFVCCVRVGGCLATSLTKARRPRSLPATVAVARGHLFMWLAMFIWRTLFRRASRSCPGESRPA